MLPVFWLSKHFIKLNNIIFFQIDVKLIIIIIIGLVFI